MFWSSPYRLVEIPAACRSPLVTYLKNGRALGDLFTVLARLCEDEAWGLLPISY